MAVAPLDTSVYIIIGNAGCTKTLWKISGKPIYPPFPQCLSVLRGARRRDAELLVASLFELATVRWEPSVDCGKQAGLSEASGTRKTGAYMIAETSKTMR